MKLTVRHPDGRLEERTYIFDVLFNEFLGIEIECIAENRHDILISFGDNSSELRVADVFLAVPASDWLQASSLPSIPLKDFTLPEDLRQISCGSCADIPILFGQPDESGNFFQRQGDSIYMGVDVFGSAFFMLSRYEELCVADRDEYGRFPYVASLSAQAGIIDRPIVNEYLEVLWACLKLIKPDLQRKTQRYACAPSHDVDRLFDTRDKSWSAVARNVAGDLFRRGDFALASKRLYSRAISGREDFRHEPSNTFDFIMDTSEALGLTSAFYFISRKKPELENCDYSIGMPWVRALLRRIDERGHELGLHGSYQSFSDGNELSTELSNLRLVGREEGVTQNFRGGRQHYLRWDAATTWRNWEAAGLAYDSTLTYAERAGFRSGTCYEYPVFDILSRTRLRLRERPLIVMEASLLGDRYMQLSGTDAADRVSYLASVCRKFNGQFTILWHNDNLTRRNQRALYREILKSVA